MLNLEIIPERNFLLKKTVNSSEVLIKVSGSEETSLSSLNRLPLNIAIVLDRSGSMSGHPLNEAKQSAKMLIDRMNEDDRVSIITFDNRVDVIASNQHVTNKNFLKRKIDEIETGGMTALYDGWSVAVDQLINHVNDQTFSRIMLLSDGCANQGLTDAKIICKEVAAQCEEGISTSTYGLGRNFNEELMTAMAKNGHGIAHYGQTADDLLDLFIEEFDLISSTIARRLRLRVRSEAGIRIDLVNDFPVDENGYFVLPDLAKDGQAWALFKIFIDRDDPRNKTDETTKILKSQVQYLDFHGEEKLSEWSSLSLKVAPLDKLEEIEINEEVRQRSLELQAAKVYDRAQRAARYGDWETVDRLLVDLKSLGNDSPWIDASIEKITQYAKTRQNEYFSKEASYSSSRLNSRLLSNSEILYSVDHEVSKPSYLRRKSEQGKRFGR